MSSLQKSFLFFAICYSLFTVCGSAVKAAEPGLNLINQPTTESYVSDSQVKNWEVITPESPENLDNYKSISASNVVIRIHAWWSDTGKKMLGSNSEQQQVASAWCSAINSFPKSNIYIEPFNELEQTYECASPEGQIGLSTCISRAQSFIGKLSSCLSKGQIISPALDPQNANFPTTSAAFSNFGIISCHPYSFDGLNNCLLLGKQFLFTEIGALDKSSGRAVYNDCRFIEFFAKEKFIEGINSNPYVIAYFLFTFQPDSGPWKLQNESVVNALKGETSNLTCSLNDAITQIIKNYLAPNSQPKTKPNISRGISTGPLTTTATGLIDRLNPIWWIKYFFRENSHEFPFNYKDTDQYIENVNTELADMDDMVKIIQPTYDVTDTLKTIVNGAEKIGVLVQHNQDVDGHPPSNYPKIFEDLGPGFLFGLDSQPHSVTEEGARSILFNQYYQFVSGSSPRALPVKYTDNSVANDYLCRLAASSDPNNPRFNKSMNRLFDEVIGYLDSTLEHEFTTNLPNGVVDRLVAEGNDAVVPVRISDFLCSNKNLDSALANCASYGTISSSICDKTPDWKKTAKYEVIYDIFWPRFQQLAVVKQNASTKIFIERCQEQDKDNCTEKPLSSNLIVSGHFGDLDIATRMAILKKDGNFSKSGNKCLSCKVTVAYMPIFTKTQNITSTMNEMLTPYSTHRKKNTEYSQTLDYSSVTYDAAYKSEDPSPMGVDNTYRQYDVFRSILEGVAAFLTRSKKIATCQINYEERERDNGVIDYIPQNACRTRIVSSLYTIVYVPKSFQQFFNDGKNLYTHFTPAKDLPAINQAVLEATNGTTSNPYNFFNSSVQTGNNLPGDETPKEMYRNGHDTAGYESYDPAADRLYYGQDPGHYKAVVDQYLLPVSWQSMF